MPDPPPPNHYASYPRSNTPARQGTPEQLRALGDGYFGQYYVFFANIALAFLTNAMAQVAGQQGLIAAGIGSVIIIFVLTLPYNRKIALGMGWPPGRAILASALTGLSYLLCCGAFGYSAMQTYALREIKKYGIKPGIWGLRKKDYRAVADNWVYPDPIAPTDFSAPPK